MKDFFKTNKTMITWGSITTLSILYVIYLVMVPSGLQQLVNGVQVGAIYALIALGYTMVYGIIKLINFAHADIFMIGAYLGLFIFNLFEIHLAEITLGAMIVYFVLISIITMIICASIGVIMEKLAYKPLRYKPRLSALITALGVSLFLENFLALKPFQFGGVKLEFTRLVEGVDKAIAWFPFGPDPQSFPRILDVGNLYESETLIISHYFWIYLLITAVLLGGLYYIVQHTMLGKQMRAVSFDKDSASLMGININKIISFTFVIGPALAGVSGILYAMNYTSIANPYLGIWPGWKAFIAAVLGGIGNLPGAVLGSFIMGISEAYAKSIDSNLGDGIAFLILILILLVRPAGLLGKETVEKV